MAQTYTKNKGTYCSDYNNKTVVLQNQLKKIIEKYEKRI